MFSAHHLKPALDERVHGGARVMRVGARERKRKKEREKEKEGRIWRGAR